MKLLFTNKIYEYEFDQTGVRIKNIETDARTKRFSPEYVLFVRSLLLRRAEGKAYGRFSYDYVRDIFGKPDLSYNSTYQVVRRLTQHLRDSIFLSNFIVTYNGLDGFLLNENIRAMRIQRRSVNDL